MNFSSEIIDQIVDSVMRALQTRESAAAHAAPAHPVPVSSESIMSMSVGSTVITEDVLTQLDAAGKLISLSASAVITPSGRDYIRRNNVRLASSVSPGRNRSHTGLLITIGTASAAASAATAAGWSTMSVASEFDAADLALQHEPGRILVCCGGEPSVVACLLNRNPSVRAAVVSRTTSVTALASRMNPRMFCLESAGWSFTELLQLLKSLPLSPSAAAGWRELDSGRAATGGPR